MLFKSIGIKGLRHHRLGFQQEASFQQMMILGKKNTLDDSDAGKQHTRTPFTPLNTPAWENN